MSNSKFYFIVLRKPLFYLLAMSVILFVCIWVFVSRLPCINTTGVRQETQLDFLCPLSKENCETLNDLAWVIRVANFRIKTAREEGVESFDHIVNDERLREALDVSKKIISNVDSRIVMPDIFWSYSYLRSNPCQESILPYFRDFRELAHLCHRQTGYICTILSNSFEIHESQSDVDLMLQSLLLLESLCNSVQLDSLYSCVKCCVYYRTIALMYRPLETYPVESQFALKKCWKESSQN